MCRSKPALEPRDMAGGGRGGAQRAGPRRYRTGGRRSASGLRARRTRAPPRSTRARPPPRVPAPLGRAPPASMRSAAGASRGRPGGKPPPVGEARGRRALSASEFPGSVWEGLFLLYYFPSELTKKAGKAVF